MAQALFDEHPLEEYLRDAGESPFSIPGISPDLEREIDPNYDLVDDTSDEAPLDWYPRILLNFLEALQSVISSTQSQHKSSPFVERFKYNIISSSLLAPSLSAPHPRHLSRPLSIPGKLGHSRASSVELDCPTSPSLISPSDPSYSTISFTAASAAVLLSIGYPSLALITLLATFLMYTFISTTDTPKHDMTSSFNALDDLMAANNMWESVVQDTVTFLDNEERILLRSSSGPSSPSPIRVALYSCLQTTHTQCDNIRHLFSALTCPAELSQLAEMYAPPSPIKTGFSIETNSRPFFYPLESPSRASFPPTTPESKRSTWNGSYASLAHAGSPPNSVYRRRDKHRANLSDVFEIKSAPVTPLRDTLSTPIPEVPEDLIVEEPSTSTSSYFSPISGNFGAAALDLQRKRKSGGAAAFRTPPPNYFMSDLRSPRSARNSMFASTITSSSKFTNVQPARHPLSYSALTYSLQGALSAKRYTCSHLLALRFSDEEDEGYWEDVKSVMGLLTSTLADTSSRLSEALDEVERQKLQEQNPTPIKSLFSGNELDPIEAANNDNTSKRRRIESKISFAPVPNHISRFAAHIAAITSALDDARENLEQCVSAVKSDPIPSTSATSKRLPYSRSFCRVMSPGPQNEVEPEEPLALQAYERLRRELGLALRECERGRARLLEIINPPPIPSDDEEEFEDLPGLAHDASDESDKPDPNSPSSEDDEPGSIAAVVKTAGGEGEVEGVIIDDATSHLLLATTPQHLPLPGIEEVFEADTGAIVAFARERSKLTREERIKLAKARRESGIGLGIEVGVGGSEEGDTGKMGVEKWGPGGEVVQELKDVIWKVREKRRKLTDSGQAQSVVPESLESS